MAGNPLVVAPGVSIDLPLRFRPTSFGPKAGTITVLSDDPAGPKTVHVSGDAPAGKLVATGLMCFGEVPACCHEERTISICNVGDCKLHVSSVAFKHTSPAWKLINDPFPATLHPGACLGVAIGYHAIERFPRPCELIITSDDPAAPLKSPGTARRDDLGRASPLLRGVPDQAVRQAPLRPVRLPALPRRGRGLRRVSRLGRWRQAPSGHAEGRLRPPLSKAGRVSMEPPEHLL